MKTYTVGDNIVTTTFEFEVREREEAHKKRVIKNIVGHILFVACAIFFMFLGREIVVLSLMMLSFWLIYMFASEFFDSLKPFGETLEYKVITIPTRFFGVEKVQKPDYVYHRLTFSDEGKKMIPAGIQNSFDDDILLYESMQKYIMAGDGNLSFIVAGATIFSERPFPNPRDMFTQQPVLHTYSTSTNNLPVKTFEVTLDGVEPPVLNGRYILPDECLSTQEKLSIKTSD